ncbi:RidA family protein [Arthrobacter sp. ISL-28]|uniref:RidA family protein n=1 Tax=Arthrobacter sp. ISL-28 TaxID=2819108 RepID=UPI00288AADF4|nr:RidA family protein [Arthrobacter sp. ISL-28]
MPAGTGTTPSVAPPSASTTASGLYRTTRAARNARRGAEPPARPALLSRPAHQGRAIISIPLTPLQGKRYEQNHRRHGPGAESQRTPLPGRTQGPILQISGQLPFDPHTGDLVGTTVAEQTTRVLRNVAAVLDAAGAGMADVVMLRVYLTDPANLAEMNDAYAVAVGEPYPARTTVYMKLPPGLLVEIDALAVLTD